MTGSPRQLAGTPTKSPSSGLHKPTWKPSSKPAEHRRLAAAGAGASPGPKAFTLDALPNLLGKKIKPTSAPTRGTPPLTPKNDKDTHTGKPQERTSTGKSGQQGRDQDQDVAVEEEEDSSKVRGSGSSGMKKGAFVHPSRMLSEKTASSVSQAAKNAIYGLSGPTKSPSTGLHKPTWKPTPGTPTGKPLEAASAGSSSSGKQASSSQHQVMLRRLSEEGKKEELKASQEAKEEVRDTTTVYTLVDIFY